MRKIGIIISLSFLLFNCSNDDNNGGVQVPQAEVIVTLLNFTYTPQVGNMPERLVYEFEIENISDIDAQGGLRITISADGLLSTSIPTSQSQCYQIPANSTCIYSFDETGDINIEAPDSVTYIGAEYVFF